MAKTVKNQVLDILAAQTLIPVEQLASEARTEDLGITSLALVETIFAIEETFDIEVPFNANTGDHAEFDHSSIGTIIAAVEHLVAQKSG